MDAHSGRGKGAKIMILAVSVVFEGLSRIFGQSAELHSYIHPICSLCTYTTRFCEKE